LFKEK
ncbi:hypothetical protein AB3S75_004789, partial [Citrus x aurantiifolia]